MYIGLDIGGTNFKIGVIDENGKLVHQYTAATNAHKGLDYVLNLIKRMLTITMNKFKNAKSIGVGIPGIVDEEGTVKISPNLPEWYDIALGKFLRNQFSLPIEIDNDANAAAAAEMLLGAGKNETHFLYVTLGTGVGGAIVYDRKILRGKHRGAGEIGHVIIDAHESVNSKMPFRTGILEEYVGRNQITAFAARVIKNYPDSILHKYDRPDPYFVSEASAQNDEAAIEIFTTIGEYLGLGLVSAMNLLDMRLVIIGGGISLAHPILFDVALKTIKERAIPTIAKDAEIRRAEFTKDAGIIGAALLGKYYYLQQIKQNQ